MTITKDYKSVSDKESSKEKNGLVVVQSVIDQLVNLISQCVAGINQTNGSFNAFYKKWMPSWPRWKIDETMTKLDTA